MFQRTLTVFRRATVTIPPLSPTLTKAKIVEWCFSTNSDVELHANDPVFVLQASPDLMQPENRKQKDDEPLMIVETSDVGKMTIHDGIELNKWYDVGTEVGVIDDGDDKESESGEWLWQGYEHQGKSDQVANSAV